MVAISLIVDKNIPQFGDFGDKFAFKKIELTYNGRKKVSNKLEDLSIRVVWW